MPINKFLGRHELIPASEHTGNILTRQGYDLERNFFMKHSKGKITKVSAFGKPDDLNSSEAKESLKVTIEEGKAAKVESFGPEGHPIHAAANAVAAGLDNKFGLTVNVAVHHSPKS